MTLLEKIRAAVVDAGDADRSWPPDVSRSADEIRGKIDELDDAIGNADNEYEMIANRASRDALEWAAGAEIDVVVDSREYTRGRDS